MKDPQRPTADAVEIMNRRFGNDPERRARLEQIKENMAIGSQIYAARTAAGLTQKQLAERIGTSQSVISDLEDAEYEGHTMSMLRRIAEALNARVEVQLKTAEPESELVVS